MATIAIALGAFVLYILAYHTYGKYLARRIFRIDPARRAPAEELNDGIDFVPSRRELVFGHHFTSIAGTGPIVGPAVAVIWGWIPALIWVLVGSIVMGAVHDFGSLIISMRHQGRTIADLAGDVVTPRVRILFLIVVTVGLWIVLAIFGLVIAVIFDLYPSSVMPVFLQIPIAVAFGIWVRRGGSLILGGLVSVILMYASIAVAANYEWAQVTLPAAITSWISPVAFWTLILLVYVFIASVLPVQTLLQPRDFINAWQLLIAMGLLLIGLLVSHPPIVADAVNFRPAPANPGAAVPAFMPFLFVTIACGAISGFHCLVSSGCSSRQLKTEADAQYVGYGAMLTEGFLATLVILACVAGIGLGTSFDASRLEVVLAQLDPPATGGHSIDSELLARARITPVGAGINEQASRGDQQSDEVPTSGSRIFGQEELVTVTVAGRDAWLHHYATWGGDAGLPKTLAPFVAGSANMIESIGISHALAIAIMGVFVASFAATTMDSACRLQRYVLAELLGGARHGLSSDMVCRACGYSMRGIGADPCPECGCTDRRTGSLPPTTAYGRLVANRFVVTTIAVVTAAVLALSDAPTRGLTHAGTGGLILWPIFGATNQLLGGLALLVITVWLARSRRPTWATALPMLFMLAMTGWAISDMILAFANAPGKLHLLVISTLMLALEVWIALEAIILVLRSRHHWQAEPVSPPPA